MNMFKSDNVLPFANADHRFLQVLVPEFRMRRMKKGCCLDLRFDGRSLAVWSDFGKRHVRQKIRGFDKRAGEYQKKLDSFLLKGACRSFSHSNKGFPFRYASGGTLPIVRQGHKEYYCLFYRDIDPIGWNIANGGCDSIRELLNPTATIERELREELVAFDPEREEWLQFEAREDTGLDEPGLLAVRKIIAREYPHLNLDRFAAREIPLKWLEGPDELHVAFEKNRPSVTRGCFLNINALDFGIEVDRVARLAVGPETILFDGESWGDMVTDSPVGLFELESFNHHLKAGSHTFMPDVFFHNARRHNDGPGQIGKAISRYVNRMVRYRPYGALKAHAECPKPFDLCPVTRRIAERYLATLTPQRKEQYDVFISFASEDRPIARQVHSYLVKRSGKRAFFSDTSIHDGDWAIQIEEALLSAERLILVGTSLQNILKRYVEYEWRTFHMLHLTEPEKKRTIVPFLIGVDSMGLPLPLRPWQGCYLPNARKLAAYLPRLV